MLVTSFERMSEMLLLVASRGVVTCVSCDCQICLLSFRHLSGLFDTPEASVGEHAQKMFARQIFQTFGNPPPTCPPCMVPTHFSRFLLSDLVQT